MSAVQFSDGRRDDRLAAIIDNGIAIDRTAGVVSAWVFLRRFELPGETIVRVLCGGENVRSPLNRRGDAQF